MGQYSHLTNEQLENNPETADLYHEADAFMIECGQDMQMCVPCDEHVQMMKDVLYLANRYHLNVIDQQQLYQALYDAKSGHNQRQFIAQKAVMAVHNRQSADITMPF